MKDLIERQAAIDALRAMQTYKLFAGDDMLLIDQAGAQTELMMLPSAQPERKGKWIEMGINKDGTHSIRCSKCGGGYKTRGHARSIATKVKYKFCPNCGAYMRGESDG